MRIEVVSGVWLVILAVGVFVVIHKKHQDVRLRNPALGKPPRGLPQGSHAARLIEFTPLLIHRPRKHAGRKDALTIIHPMRRH